MFTSIGTIVTDPKSKSTAFGEWWIIVDTCPELGRYYNSLLKFANRAKQEFRLQVPSWGYHISVVRGEPISTPEGIELYKSVNGQSIEFSYSHEVISDGRYFWLPVQCEALLDIRERMGLPRKPRFSFHLTVGVNPLVKEREWV